VSAIRRTPLTPYPPIQNGKEREGGLLLPVDYARFGALATTTTPGQVSAADFNKLHNWPVIRLAYSAAADLANATNMGVAGTANVLVAAQNFTVNSATAILDVFVNTGILINAPAALTQATLRVLLDGATLYKLGPGIALANGWMSFSGGAFPIGPGLAAGVHTIALTLVASQANALLYCRAATAPLYEWATITIVERQP